jgi:hypothetical protein
LGHESKVCKQDSSMRDIPREGITAPAVDFPPLDDKTVLVVDLDGRSPRHQLVVPVRSPQHTRRQNSWLRREDSNSPIIDGPLSNSEMAVDKSPQLTVQK